MAVTIICPQVGHWVCTKCTETANHGNIYLKVDIQKDEANKRYIGVFSARMDGLSTSWQWSGKSRFAVTVNGVSSGYVDTEFPLRGAMLSTEWVGNVSMVLTPNASGQVIVSAHIDARRTTGYYGGQGPSSHFDDSKPNGGPDKGNLTDVYFNDWNLQVQDYPELSYGSKPTVSNLRNNNPYKYDMDGAQQTMNNVSEYIDGIYVKCDLNNGGAAITKAEYSVNGGAWTAASGTGDTINIRNLTAGTKYSIKVRYTNSVGSTEAGPIDIYTLHKSPVLTLTKNNSSSSGTNLVFDWTSDKPLSSLQYDMDGKTYKVKIPTNATSGTINIGLAYGSSASIKAKGRSTQAYHYRWSGEPSASGSTPELPPPTIPGITFGLPFTVGVSPSDNIYAAVGLSVKKAWWVATTGSGSGSSITVNPTQAHWDAFYRQFPKNTDPNPNRLECVLGIEVHYMVTRYDEDGNAYQEEEECSYTIDPKYVVLTGIAKTAHIGVNDSPRRAQVWYGDSSGRARRGVTWAGAPDGTHRCI